jgi:tetratricopeptide (TPR) repeat protein
VGKGLIRPERAAGTEELFRFHHVLVRDVAYAGLPVATRAELHEHFADWLEGQPDTPDEIVGYHFEQAAHYRAQLGLRDEHALELASRAAEKLTSAANPAFRRGDSPAAAALIDRAAALLPTNSLERLRLLTDLARFNSQYSRARELVDEAVRGAREVGDEGLERRALLVGASLFPPDPDLIQIAEGAIPLFEKSQDVRGLAIAWSCISIGHANGGRASASLAAANRQIEHARSLKSGFERPMLAFAAMSALDGATSVKEALCLCKKLLAQTDGNRRAEAEVVAVRAHLQAMADERADARVSVEHATAIAHELVMPMVWVMVAEVALLAGEAEVAEQTLRGDVPDLVLPLAEACYRQGRYEEALRYTERTHERFPTGMGAWSEIRWRSVRAKALARLGQLPEGEQLVREAVRLGEETEFLNLRADTLMDLGEISSLAGRADEAARAVEDALRLYEQKGNVVSARRARALLEELRATASA